jgi:hypothetical protein
VHRNGDLTEADGANHPRRLTGNLQRPLPSPARSTQIGARYIVSDKTANIVIGVVTAIWAGNVIVGMFGVAGYQPSEGINAIFTGIVGGAFALRARNRNGDGGDNK